MSNVKPGDLAIVVRASPASEWTRGRLVEIEEPCCVSSGVNLIWRFKQALTHPGKEPIRCGYDSCLKKIDPLQDETTTFNIEEILAKIPEIA